MAWGVLSRADAQFRRWHLSVAICGGPGLEHLGVLARVDRGRILTLSLAVVGVLCADSQTVKWSA